MKTPALRAQEAEPRQGERRDFPPLDVTPSPGGSKDSGELACRVLSQRMVSPCHGNGQPRCRVSGVRATANREVLVPETAGQTS